MSKSFEPVAEKLPVDVIFPVHDRLTKEAELLHVNVGPEIIPVQETLPAVNIPALSVPELVRVPVVVRLTALNGPVLLRVPVQLRVPEVARVVIKTPVVLIVIWG